MSAENETVEPVGAIEEGAKPDSEQLGEAGLSALKSEREARKVAEKQAADLAGRLKEFEDRGKSESEKQQEALEAAKRELAELTLAKTRAEVSAATGVPVALLGGSTQEEMEAAAAEAIKYAESRTARPSSEAIGKANGVKVAGSVEDVFAEWSEKQFNQL